MLTSLKVIYSILEEINQSTKDKKDLLKKHLDDPIFGKTLKRVLEYITNDFKFNLKQIRYCVYFDDPIAAEHQHVNGIFNMLDFLNSKQDDPSDEEIAFLEKISSADPETIEVVVRILNKFSACGLTNDQIMKILKEI